MTDQYEDQTDDAGEDVEFILPANQAQDVGRKWEETRSIVHGLNAKLGFAIEQNDPEAADVPWQTSNPTAFREAYRNALIQKASRLGVTTRAIPRAAQPAAAAKQPATKAPDLAAEYRKAMDAAIKRGAGRDEKVNIRHTYRVQGVDVDKARGQ